ncbi:MAG: alpha/beta hydrolase [Casimicrobiaceae bacterium]
MDLLLLPGLLCDRAVWAPILPQLETVARCHIPDYADEGSLAAMAERALALAPATFALAGHSMGGRVALEIMRRAPARVERLALLDTGCRPRPAGAAGEEERAKRLALLALAREKGMRAMARQWVQPMVHPARHADPAFIDTILDMFERRTPLQFHGQIEALLARPDATALLPTIACQTLVLAGRADGWSTPAQHEEMAALIPGSRLAIIEDCGHMAPMERPDAIADAMVAWLRTPVNERDVADDAMHSTR